jgi:hypothetical protein
MRESRIFSGSPERLEVAARQMADTLTKKGIPYALIGGLAASAWSEPRATKDVDFLVPASARDLLGAGTTSLGGEVYGVNLKLGKTRIDILFPERDEDFLEDALAVAPTIEGMRVLQPEALTYMKLGAGRAKDTHDVIAMIQAGANVNKISKYLEKHAPDLVDDFQSLVLEASVQE